MESIVQEMKEDTEKIGKNLEIGKDYVSNARSQQDELHEQLNNVVNKVTGMLKSSSMSWWELGIMSVVALLLFLFTSAFILAF